MQGQSSKVARGLRTVGNNISNLAQEQKTLAIETQEGTKQIQLFDEATGDMRSTYDILGDIATYWDDMTNAQRQAIGIALSGKNQFEVFTATVSNFADAQKAVEYATDSENSALNENSRYMESISAKANLTKSQLQELVLGDGGLTDFVKLLLDATNSLLKFANSGIGKTLINLALLYTALMLANKGMALMSGVSLTGLITKLNDFALAMLFATSATERFEVVGKLLNLDPVLLTITAIVAVGAILVKTVKGLETSISDANQKLEESQSELEQEKQKLEDLQSQISEINKEKLSITDEDELRRLDLQKASLEAQLQIQKDITAEKEEQAKKDAEKATETTGLSVGYDERTNAKIKYIGDPTQNLKKQTDDIELLTNKVNDLIQEKNELAETDAEYKNLTEEQKNEYDKLSNSIDKYNSMLIEIKGSSAENAQVLQNAIDAGVEDSDVLEQLIDDYRNASQASEEVTDSQETQEDVLEQTAEAYGLTAEQVKAYMEANDITDITEACEALATQAENAEDVAEAYDNAISAVGSMSDSFGTLNDAVNEYNSTGQLSLDTISDLLSMDSEYLSLLQIENGQMSVNEDGAIALANSKINLAEATAVEKAQSELASIQAHTYNNTLIESAQASSVAVSSAQSAGRAILDSGNDADIAKEKWAEAWAVISQGYSFSTVQDRQYAKQVENSLKNQITSLESLRKQVTTVTKTTGSNTSATKSNTDAKKSNTSATNANTEALKENLEKLKEQKEALEDKKDAYEKVISYIEKKLEDTISDLEDARDEELDKAEEAFEQLEEQVDSYIEKLENERDTIVENAEAQIDALEKAQKAEEEYWDNRIDELETAKEKEEEYWQAKIDALKESNDELESQIELENLLAQLEQAKAGKKMVYREGQGFVYESDSESVSTAQKNLQEYYRKQQYEKQLKELEDYKESASKNYEAQIEDLENHKDAVSKNYDAQIENLETYINDVKTNYDTLIAQQEAYLKAEQEKYNAQVETIKNAYQQQIDYYQKYLDKFKEGVDKYENEQLRKKTLQLTGIDFEKEGWETQLENLDKFVKKYEKLQEKVTKATEEVTKAQEEYNKATKEASSSSSSSGSSGNSSSGSSSSSSGSKNTTQKSSVVVGGVYQHQKGLTYMYTSGAKTGQTHTTTTDKHAVKVDSVSNGYVYFTTYTGAKAKVAESTFVSKTTYKKGKTKAYANGSYGIKDDEIAIIGDDPQFSELVIGSKLNSGAKILNASKGTGIIPHNLTSTLVSMAQAFQNQTPLQTTNNSNATTISIGNISLPNVQNGEQFVDYLQNFNLDMTSMAYTR